MAEKEMVEAFCIENVLEEKETNLAREQIEAGEYSFTIDCVKGSFTLDVALIDNDKRALLEFTGKKLKKGKSFKEMQLIEDNEAPATLNIMMKCSKAGKSSFCLRVMKAMTEKKPERVLRVRIHVQNGDGTSMEKYVKLKTNIVKCKRLQERMDEKFGTGKVMKYYDAYGEIATVDDQESLEIFFDENKKKTFSEPADMYFTPPDHKFD